MRDDQIHQAFGDSLAHVLRTMMGMESNVAAPVLLNDARATRFDVSCVIGLSGEVCGVVVLGFGRQVAEALAGALAGMEMKAGSADFADAIGELGNMIAGNAKARLKGVDASISCPTVVTSDGHTVMRPRSSPTVGLECGTSAGPMCIQVTIVGSTAGVGQGNGAVAAK